MCGGEGGEDGVHQCVLVGLCVVVVVVVVVGGEVVGIYVYVCLSERVICKKCV